MTPPAAGDVIHLLYDTVDHRHLSWLDDLLIAAGLRVRCRTCDAMASVDSGCDMCGAAPEKPAVTTSIPDPIVPAEVSPAFVIACDNPIRFALDEAAFGRWIDQSDEWEAWLPDRAGEAPGHDLSALVQDALDYQVITGDPRLELQVNGDDDSDAAGFYVLLHNTHGDQRLIAITGGWSELTFPADEHMPPADVARFHLGQVRDLANWLLSDLPASAVPSSTLADLRALLDHAEISEERDYHDSDPDVREHHIYPRIQRLESWFDNADHAADAPGHPDRGDGGPHQQDRAPTHITHRETGVVEVLDRARYAAANPAAAITTCGECGRSWDDAVVTASTPAPAARCPFEHEHDTANHRLDNRTGEDRAVRLLIELDDQDRGGRPEMPYSAVLYEQRGGDKTGDLLESGIGDTPANALRDLAEHLDRHR